MPQPQEPPVCRRCGHCCHLGGPALHREDLFLIETGILTPATLVTIRRGAFVTDNVAGGVGPTPEELVKIRPGDDGRTCVFFVAPDVCSIHQTRPAECRALSCQAPQALAAMYRLDRITRSDILPAASPLGELCAHHDAETDLLRLLALRRLAAAGDAAALAEATRMERFDAAFRELLPAKAGIPPLTLPFYLGGPPRLVLPRWHRPSQGGLYKRQGNA